MRAPLFAFALRTASETDETRRQVGSTEQTHSGGERVEATAVAAPALRRRFCPRRATKASASVDANASVGRWARSRWEASLEGPPKSISHAATQLSCIIKSAHHHRPRFTDRAIEFVVVCTLANGLSPARLFSLSLLPPGPAVYSRSASTRSQNGGADIPFRRVPLFLQ